MGKTLIVLTICIMSRSGVAVEPLGAVDLSLIAADVMTTDCHTMKANLAENLLHDVRSINLSGTCAANRPDALHL
jgi:hypothetical protein